MNDIVTMCVYVSTKRISITFQEFKNYATLNKKATSLDHSTRSKEP